MKSYKKRFLTLLKNHAPIKRKDLTQRALPQLRIKMPQLKRLISSNLKAELIKSYFLDKNPMAGRAPEVFELTGKGKEWLENKNDT